MIMATTAPFFVNSYSKYGMTSNYNPGTQHTKDVKAIIETKNLSSRGLHDEDPISLKPRIVLNQTENSSTMFSDIGYGEIVKDDLVFRQHFYIRSYEIGPDRTASIETLMNHLQETAINHVKAMGLLGDGFGSSPVMCKKKLIWVIAKMQLEVDRYPIWGDVVQVDSWKTAFRNTGMCTNWMCYDSKTGEILVKASCILALMNKETRRLSKIPEEVRAEFEPYFKDTIPIVKHDTKKWSTRDENTTSHFCDGLMPRQGDLDINQHVNNVKYIGWILESVPKMILEKYELASIKLEYRQECTKEDKLQSHTFVIGKEVGEIVDNYVHCEHVLQLDIVGGGDEIVKARTAWRLKYGKRQEPYGIL